MNPIPITQEEIKQRCLTRRFPVNIPDKSEVKHIYYMNGHCRVEYLTEGRRMYDYTQSKYAICDTIPALEEWQLMHASSDLHYLYFNEGRYKALFKKDLTKLFFTEPPLNKFQPADTMPVEFSRYDLEVTEVDCKKLGDCSLDELLDEIDLDDNEAFNQAEHYNIGGSSIEGGSPEMFAYIDHWNKTHPEHPFDPDRYSFGVKFEIVKKEKKRKKYLIFKRGFCIKTPKEDEK